MDFFEKYKIEKKLVDVNTAVTLTIQHSQFSKFIKLNYYFIFIFSGI